MLDSVLGLPRGLDQIVGDSPSREGETEEVPQQFTVVSIDKGTSDQECHEAPLETPREYSQHLLISALASQLGCPPELTNEVATRDTKMRSPG